MITFKRLLDFVIEMFFLHIIVMCADLVVTFLLTAEWTKLAVDELFKRYRDHGNEDKPSSQHICPGRHHPKHDHLQSFTVESYQNNDECT